MKKTGIIYGSTTGTTKTVAEKIREKLGYGDLKDVTEITARHLEDYELLILGSSTWGYGDLQDDWGCIADELSGLELSGVKVALFGTGDQDNYPDTYIDAVGILEEKLDGSGAELIGRWPSSGYRHMGSRAEKDGIFAGLAIDEDNEPELTDGRVLSWVESISKEMQ
jgi:flavodoxin I